MENNQDKDKQTFEVIANPENSIPKFATNVNFNKLKNGDIIMSFVVKTMPNAPATLIETIIVDESHAKKIVEVLGKVIENKNNEQ